MNALAMPGEPTDSELVDRLRNGELSAIEPIYHRHAAGLLMLARHLTGSRADAEDIVQDVFVGLRTAVRSYGEAGSFNQWLRKVTVRMALTRMRAVRSRHETDLPHDLPTRDADIAGQITIENAIARLPDPLRAVFVLREIEQYPHAEIARMLGISRGTSEVRLFRAIRILRDQLKDDR
jgi:RNA polymerase sigma-70 factor (ECF subfamily)